MVNKELQTALVSRVGTQHIQMNKGNQDAIKARFVTCGKDTYTIIALADGHGADIHDLSAVGSKSAVSVTISVLTAYIKQCSEFGFSALFDVIQEEVPSQIRRIWLRNIQEDANDRGEEFNLIRYGTTLIGAIFVNGEVLAFSIGDGNGIISSQDENTVLWWTEDCGHSNITMSLCQPNSSELFKFCRFSNVESLMLTTDGLVHIKDTPEMLSKFLDDVILVLRNRGTEQAQRWIHNRLNEYQEFTFTDDITIGIVDFCSKESQMTSV